MNYVKQSISILILLSLSLFTHAEKIQDNTVNELLILSGIKSQTEDIPSTIVAMMQQSIPNLTEEQVKQAATLYSNVFNPDLVLKDVSSEIQNTISAQEAKEVLTWYESNTGNRIARAEEHASSPSAMGEFQTEAPKLMANAELMETASKLIDAMMLLDGSIEFQKSVMLATMVGISKATKPDQPIKMEDLKGFVDMQIDQSKAGLEQMLTAQLAFTYKDIEKAAMEEYLAELKKPAMKKFNESALEGTKNALNKALDRLLSE